MNMNVNMNMNTNINMNIQFSLIRHRILSMFRQQQIGIGFNVDIVPGPIQDYSPTKFSPIVDMDNVYGMTDIDNIFPPSAPTYIRLLLDISM